MPAKPRPFNPAPVEAARPGGRAAAAETADRRDGAVYVFEGRETVVLAVNIAIVTGRPLLVFGAPGSGKSSLAASVARILGRRYYEHVVTSRTQAQDLLYQFDVVRRLADAQAASSGPETERQAFASDLSSYIEPGALWWAFAPESASLRGSSGGKKTRRAVDPGRIGTGRPAVLLVDEIDKADPDIPNNLLVALGSLTFHVREIDQEISATEPPLVIITTNEERELPSAFLRRCVTVRLPPPTATDLVRIATAHFGKPEAKAEIPALDYVQIADRTLALAEEAGLLGERGPSTAEYLDCIRACLTLGLGPSDPDFEAVLAASVAKPEARVVSDPELG